MTERIDHAKEARKALDWLERAGEGAVREQGPLEVAAAQVHATLALVEQQRIASLIALAFPNLHPHARPPLTVDQAWSALTVEGRLRPDIAAALGLEVES